MTPTFKDRYKGTIINTPGVGGQLIVNTALSGYQRFDATDDGLYFDIVINDIGNTWETRKECLYTHATNTLSAGTFSDSSTGSPISLSSNAIWVVTLLSERIFPSTITTPSQDDSIYYDSTLGRFTNQRPFAKDIKQYVKNGNGTIITKGQVVYVSGASGNNVLISLAKADSDMTSATTIGFAAQDFAINGFGYIITEGYLDGLNTSAAINEGDPIWLSPTTAGGVLYGFVNKPHAPDHMVYLGVVSRKQNINGSVFIKCQNGYEINELHDVLITTPTQDDLLVYNSGTGIWENKNTLNQVQVTGTTETLSKTSNIDGWTYSGKTVAISGQDTETRGLSLSTDGTKMYVIGQATDAVYQYTLTTPFDVSTATYASKSVSVAGQDAFASSMFFKPDGTTFYILGDTSDTVYQYTLATAWDVSTATYATKSFSVTTQETAPSGLEISTDGTKMYVIGTTNDTVYQYTLATAWDVSTASYASKSFSVTTFDGTPTGIEFNNDGTKMYVVGSGYDCIIEYTLGTAWDVTTAVYTDRLIIALGVSTINPLAILNPTNPHDIYTDFTNNVAYILDRNTQRVYQYYTNTTPLKITGNKLVVNPVTYFKNDIETLGSIRALGYFEVTNAAVFSSNVGIGGTLTASGALTATSTITLSGSTTSTTSIGTAATTGTTTIGGTSQTGAITIGQSTVSQNLNLATGPTIAANTKTINIGSNSLSNSITNISIGVVAGTSNITVGSTAETQTLNLATGANASGIGKSINIGTNGASGSTTNIILGSWVQGAAGKTIASQGIQAGSNGTPIYQTKLDFGGDVAGSWRKLATVSLGTGQYQTAGYKIDIVDPNANHATIGSINADKYTYYVACIRTEAVTQDVPDACYISGPASHIRAVKLSTGNYEIQVSNEQLYQEYLISIQLYTENGGTNAATYYDGSALGSAGIATYTASVGTATDWFQQISVSGDIKFPKTSETLTKTNGVEGWNYNTSFSVSGQELTASSVSMSADGTKLYVLGTTNDTVYQYPVTTPYNISTATTTGLVSYSITATAGSPQSIFFKPDGTSFYIINDSTTDTVQRFDLSTPWVVSSATYVNAYSFTQESVPTGLEFSPDGTKMHIIGTTNDTVYQYNLSPAWDITAPTLNSSFSVTSIEAGPTGVEFNSAGTIMYIVGTGYDSVIQYNLSTAWDITSAVYNQKLPLLAGGFTVNTPRDIYVDLTNNIMLIIDDSADRVFQYNTNTNALLISGNNLVISPKTILRRELWVEGLSRFINQVELLSPVTAYSSFTVGSTFTTNGTTNLAGSTTSTTSIGTAATTGITTIGGTSQTGAITIAPSTASQNLNLATGATASGSTKTINIGTNGLAGSTTNIAIGSETATTGITAYGGLSVQKTGSGRVGLGTDSGGSVTIGRQDNVASSPYIDFNSGSTTIDYDTRIIAGGGNGTVGNGTLSILTGSFGVGTATPSAKLEVNGSVKFPSVGTSGLVGLGTGGSLSSVTIGSGLSLSSGTLSATGGTIPDILSPFLLMGA